MTTFRLTAVLLLTLFLTVAVQARSQTIEKSKDFTLSQRIYGSVGPTILQRSNPEGGSIVGANPGGGTPSFVSSSDYDFGWKGGIDATLGLRILKSGSLEARLLNFDSATSFSTVTPGNFIGVGFTGPGGTTIRSNYRTKLRSREINWRQGFFDDRLDLLGGVRRISLGDDLGSTLNGAVAASTYAYRNRMMGPQIGADLSLLPKTSRFEIHVTGKVGRYFGKSRGGIYEFAGGVPIGSFTGSASDPVTALEGGFSAKYRFTDNLAAHVGFDILSLKDVALASNNASASITNPSLLNTNVFRDDLLFKGLNVGLTWSF